MKELFVGLAVLFTFNCFALTEKEIRDCDKIEMDSELKAALHGSAAVKHQFSNLSKQYRHHVVVENLQEISMAAKDCKSMNEATTSYIIKIGDLYSALDADIDAAVNSALSNE